MSPLSRFRSPHALCHVPSGDVLLALSGGADSRTLLHLLYEDARTRGYRLAAAHVHHGIRGAEADRDEAFCRRLCEDYGILLYVLHADVPRLAAEQGLGIEECARQVRYDYLESLMAREGFSLLATAHNADDNLETVLLDLTRGASLDGLGGIPPVRPFGKGLLVRPLLGVERRRILDFCRENALDFVTDSTNADTTYTRNLLRAEVLPVLRQINPAVTEAAERLCADLRADAAYLNDAARAWLSSHATEDGLDVLALCDAPRPIATRALAMAFKKASDGIAPAHTHVDALLSLCERGTPHASYDLPSGLCAVLEGGRLRMTRRETAFPDVAPYEQALHEGINVISQTGCEIFIGNSQSKINIYKNSIRMYFASDTIKGTIVARSRRAGDRIASCGMHKQVRRLLCDQKLPLSMRARLPILADDDGILAVPSVAVRDGVSAKRDDPNATCITVAWPNE